MGDVDDETLLLLSPSTQSDDEKTRKKKFLFHLVSALHNAGNLSYRTEDYIRTVARAYGLHCSCSIFPVTVIMSFQDSPQLSASSSDSYTLRISSGWNCRHLSMLDQLCFQISQARIDFHSAELALRDIENEPKAHHWTAIAASYVLASFSATTLFFGGTWLDGIIAGFLGLVVYVGGTFCEKYHGLAEIECFISSFLVSSISSFLDRYAFHGRLCLFGQLFGGVVWLLPGLSITIAILEIYSRMIVYGSSRLMYGISQALQLGFGLAVGYKVIYTELEIPESFENGCHSPIDPLFGFLLLPIAAASMGVIINADWNQLPGMIMCAGVGQFVSFWLKDGRAHLGEEAVPLIAALCATATARLFAYYTKQRPLVYIIGGLLVLVPGGVGVRGMSQMWSGNSSTGMEFTFKMLMIGVSLAIGVFVALIPRKQWLIKKPNQAANVLASDDSSITAKLLLSPVSNDSTQIVGSTENV